MRGAMVSAAGLGAPSLTFATLVMLLVGRLSALHVKLEKLGVHAQVISISNARKHPKIMLLTFRLALPHAPSSS